MILVDTSIWVSHLKQADAALQLLLREDQVLCHSFVLGEIALGNLKHRQEILELLTLLPSAKESSHEEALAFVSAHQLHGKGIGWVDTHLLAAAKLSGAALWTEDKALLRLSERLGLAFRPSRR